MDFQPVHPRAVRENPAGGLLDLKILLGEISRHAPEGKPEVVQPRVISAIGERTERSHEVKAAYEAFRRRLGEPEAIGDYLEGIYADIFEGKVPSSDIDGSLARDFLRFVATASPEEHEIRFFFWYAQFFQTLDLYEASAATFERGIELTRQQGRDPDAILAEARISRGSILMHLNDLAGAKEAFLSDARRSGAGPFAQAKNLFGAGEVELACGATRPGACPGTFLPGARTRGSSRPGAPEPGCRRDPRGYVEEERDALPRYGAVPTRPGNATRWRIRSTMTICSGAGSGCCPSRRN